MSGEPRSIRGDQTREALLEAAVQVFGRDGFHAASTRSIATAAGVNQALISYHFGSKEGLYFAVFDTILAQLREVLTPVVQSQEISRLESPVDEAAARAVALQVVESLFSALIDGLGRASTTNWAPLIMREQQDPGEAFERLYEQLYQPFFDVLIPALGVLLDVPADSEAARGRAVMLMGQVIVFMAARTTSTRVMGWKEVGRQEMAVVQRQFLASIRDQFYREVQA